MKLKRFHLMNWIPRLGILLIASLLLLACQVEQLSSLSPKIDSVANESPTSLLNVIQGKHGICARLKHKIVSYLYRRTQPAIKIELTDAGSLTVLADCNRGMGTYESTVLMNDPEVISGELNSRSGSHA